MINANQIHCGDHFTIYTNIQLLRCIPETNIMLYFNYISILKIINTSISIYDSTSFSLFFFFCFCYKLQANGQCIVKELLERSRTAEARTTHLIVNIKWKVKWKSLGCIQLFETLWTIQSMEFSRPESWSG